MCHARLHRHFNQHFVRISDMTSIWVGPPKICWKSNASSILFFSVSHHISNILPESYLKSKFHLLVSSKSHFLSFWFFIFFTQLFLTLSIPILSPLSNIYFYLTDLHTWRRIANCSSPNVSLLCFQAPGGFSNDHLFNKECACVRRGKGR